MADENVSFSTSHVTLPVPHWHDLAVSLALSVHDDQACARVSSSFGAGARVSFADDIATSVDSKPSHLSHNTKHDAILSAAMPSPPDKHKQGFSMGFGM